MNFNLEEPSKSLAEGIQKYYYSEKIRFDVFRAIDTMYEITCLS